MNAYADHKDPSWHSLGIIGLSLVAFVAACWGGIHLGIAFRVHTYPPLSELVAGTEPTPTEWAVLHELQSHLQSNHVDNESVKNLYATSIKPILASKDFKCGCGCDENDCRCGAYSYRTFHLREVVDRIKQYKVNPSAIPVSYKKCKADKPKND